MATGYVVLKAVRHSWSGAFSSAKIVRATQRKPVLGNDEIAVKINVEIPSEAFEPLQPEATLVVPDTLVQHSVRVEARRR